MHTINHVQRADLAAPLWLASCDPFPIASLAATGPPHPRIARLSEAAPRVDEAGGDQRNIIAESPDSAARDAAQQADKEFATLRAGQSLAGFELRIVGGDGGYTACLVRRWSLPSILPDQAAVREFAERAGGASMRTTHTAPGRLHPLLFAPCTCSLRGALCLACARWQRQYRKVTERRRHQLGGNR